MNIQKSQKRKTDIKKDILEAAKDYEKRIIGRRWIATLIDFALFFSMILLLALLVQQNIFEKAIFVLFFFILIYYAFSETFYGATLGKKLCKIKVVTEYGENPTMAQSLLRTLTRVIEVNPILAGGIPAGLVAMCSMKGQRVGDMFAGTYVLRLVDIEEAKKMKEEVTEEETVKL